MQPSQTRLGCRAHNRFSPSVVLWQYFVARNRPLRLQQRLSSSATEAPQHSGGEGAEGEGSQKSITTGDSKTKPRKNDQPEGITERQPKIKVRKSITSKGEWYSTPANASKAKNITQKHKIMEAAHTHTLATARAAFRASTDYEGIVVKPLVSPIPIWESNLPWCVREEERTLPGIERLALEIPRFHKYARPNQLQSIARKHVIETVREHVRDFSTRHVLELFGSERTGTALATSDIDLRLMQQGHTPVAGKSSFPPDPAQRERLRKDLRRLYQQYLKKNQAYVLSTLRDARYPLISIQHKASGQDVQIVLANDTSVSRKLMEGYMDEYPYLAQLHSVAKVMLDLRGLSDVFRGGFGSYSLFMMIVASLRHMPHPRKDAAGGLINFLKFYRDFDTTKYGISIEPVLLFDKNVEAPITDTAKSKIKEGVIKPLPIYMLTLRDPADETNDLGRKGLAIKHLQVTFGSLLDQLQQDIRINTRHSLLAPLVGPCYRLQEERRVKLTKYGGFVKDELLPGGLAETAKAIRDADQRNTDVSQKMDTDVSQKMNTGVSQEMNTKKQTGRERDTTWDKMTGEKFRQLQAEVEKEP